MLQRHERIYLQYQPDESSLKRLLHWQDISAESNPQARRVQPDRVHLTVVHFGILADVFRELQQAVPSLTWDVYQASVASFLQDAQTVLPTQATVVPHAFELFGSYRSVLALRVIPDGVLVQAHQQALTYLKECLQTCGIQHPVAFMQGSANFRFALQLQPHISLLRSARSRPEINLVAGQPLVLHAMNLHYR
ncbi:hypothetical protein BH23PAT2_BH23PAT2_05290 [soil metagenome]